MKRFLKAAWPKLLLGHVAIVVIIQFIPYGVETRATRDEPQWDSARTEALFDTACADCHSNETKLLWFERVAPVKWYVAGHVEEGRSALNVSEWHTAAGREVDEVGETITDGSMPPDYYTYFGLHGDAILSADQKKALTDGLRKTMSADPPRGGEG